MSEELKARDCAGCQKQPDIMIQYGGGVKIGCTECGRSISESLHVEAAFEAWNKINMDYVELANHAVKKLDEERERWLDNYREAAGFKPYKTEDIQHN